MADRFLDAHPGLRPYLLSDVQLTGTIIGGGAYGSVDEVTIPLCAAAKRVHDVLMSSSKIVTQFAKELQLMSTLHHPNIVQFLGVCFFPGSRLPALVMERRLLTSLHDLLDPETGDQPPPVEPTPLSFFKIDLKCSVLHNVASGLAYLHERTPPIIHRDLSAKNVLLTSQLVAKLADLGMARIVPHMRAATMTKAPGASVYMPPEAIAPAESNDEKSKYNASIDVFSFGVVTIFTLGEMFPCDPLAPTYTNLESGMLAARTELQRRSKYMQNVNTKLRACGQLHGDHPLIRLIQQCLHNVPAKRPNIREVLHLLEEARAGIRNKGSERNKYFLVQTLQNQPRKQSQTKIIDNLVTENTELQQQLVSSKRETQTFRQQLLMQGEELTRVKETIRQLETEKYESMQKKDRELAQAQQKDRELAQAQQQLRQLVSEKDKLLNAKDRELDEAQQQLRQLRKENESNRREQQKQLQISEATVADFHKAFRQIESELEALRSKKIDKPHHSTASQASETGVNGGPRPRINSRYRRELSHGRFLIKYEHITLLEVVGQGEFGIVYKARLWRSEQEVAVKILKGHFDQRDVDKFVEESLKMSRFKHAHVMGLIRVCLDGGPAPHIVMPFMANGSLLKYLKRERGNIVLSEITDEDEVLEVRKRLMVMCSQIASGMEYLAQEKYVHRDLAARNCMIDYHFVIKITDFGLCEDVFVRNYFRQGSHEEVVKLPVKWMAPESLIDGYFSEKSDVWSYGVTMWEIFSGGKAPFLGINPLSLIQILEKGDRMPKPNNAACTDVIYVMMRKCWAMSPDDRPTFKDLYSRTSKFIERIAGYLDLGFNPFTTVKTVEDGKVETSK